MGRALPILVTVTVIGVLIGALLDLMFGPVLSFGSSGADPEPPPESRRVAESPSQPTLSGVARPPSSPGGQPTPPAVPSAAPPEELPESHPPSSLPSVILDVYAKLDPQAYRSLFAPARMYSVLDDIESAVTGVSAPVEEVPLEDGARAAATRRGETRLPADRFLAVGIPIGAQHHEVFVGILPETDAGGSEQVLRALAKDAGLNPRQLDRTLPSYAEALAIAESYVRERIKFRALEQAYLSRLMSATGGRYGMLSGQCFVILPGGKGMIAIPPGTDQQLDVLIDAYVRAPESERAALRAMRPK